jgi:hypothetical protein
MMFRVTVEVNDELVTLGRVDAKDEEEAIYKCRPLTRNYKDRDKLVYRAFPDAPPGVPRG